MTELQSLVRAAQDGDKDAFGQVVMRFQDMAYASAYATVGDAGLDRTLPRRHSSTRTLTCRSCAIQRPFRAGFAALLSATATDSGAANS